MRIRGYLLAAVLGALIVPAAAGADTTLGTTAQPVGSTAQTCPAGPSPPANEFLIDVNPGGGSTVAGPLTVPSSSSPMAITHWAVNAAGVTAVEQVTLAVIRVNLTGPTPSILVVGADTETVTPPASPAADIESFTLSHPIQVQANDIIGQYASGPSTGLKCYWSSVPGSPAQVEGLPLPSPPTAGEQLPTGGSGLNSNASELNLSATLTPVSYDAGLTLSSAPANAVVGQPAVLTATVTNNGPLGGPVTFTDPVPAGLTVDYAATSAGSCSTSTVNIVTCSLADLAVGQSERVAIVVTPKSAQSYPDSGAVSLSGGGTDPNPANNNATTTLRVSRAGAPTQCTVPKLGGTSLAIAKRLLSALGCTVGKVRKTASHKVPKGDVISTSPGAGSYTAGRKVAITVSSGKPKKKHKK